MYIQINTDTAQHLHYQLASCCNRSCSSKPNQVAPGIVLNSKNGKCSEAASATQPGMTTLSVQRRHQRTKETDTLCTLKLNSTLKNEK